MSAIQNISAHSITDSRGEETIVCAVTLESGLSTEASVPRGKSTGSHEAVTVSVDGAVKKISETIMPRLVGHEAGHQKEIDDVLCDTAGAQKRSLGGNTTLAVSIAIARAHALETKTPLWKYIRELSGIQTFPSSFPKPFVNLINGGVHTGNMKLFQEYTLVPQKTTMKESLAYADAVRKKLGALIEKRYPGTQLGDEGGFALATNDPIEPFKHMIEASDGDALFALDAAATESMYTDENRTEIFKKMIAQFPVAYIEDPYGEEAFDAFAVLQGSVRGLVCVGDDLTTTNIARMEKAFTHKSILGVIIKPNQIGTVTEALSAAARGREYGWQVIASHRSGETEDAFIADFAYGVGADGIKIGTSVQKERWAKYDRLERIEEEIIA